MVNSKTDLGQPLQFDPNFDGPLKNRSCTDVICLGIFILFIGAWIGIGLYAIRNGDTSMLLVPKDSAGRRCGTDRGLENKPYLFFYDLTKCLGPSVPFTGCPTPQVCVEKCPSDVYIANKINEPADFHSYCTDNTEDEECPAWFLPSIEFQRRCIPNLSMVNNTVIQQIHDFISLDDLTKSIANIKLLSEAEEVGQNIVEDLIHSWWKILIGLLLALVTCIIYIAILRWLAAPMVWFSIIGALVALGGGIYFTAIKYIDTRDTYDKENDVNDSHLKTKRDLWLTGLIILSIITLIILLVVIVLRKRILLAIALIEEGSKAVSSVTASLFFPVCPWILQVGVIAYAIVVGLLLASTGEPLYRMRNIDENCSRFGFQNGTICQPDSFADNVTIHANCKNATCKFIRMQNDALYPYLQAYNIFGFFWLAFFVSAFGQMVLAAIFAQWYWTWDKRSLPFFAVTSATFRTLRFHIGTLAFGSLIITICRLIRVFLEYIDHKLKKYDNEITRAIMCCLKCFFYCLEKFLKFINKNAYIMCAIHGKNFCLSAKDAFLLLMRNILRVFVLDKVTDFLFFLSKVLIMLGVGAVSYVIFVTDLWSSFIDNSALNYGIVPVVIIMICTYLISSLFFGVYSMAVDTLFLCFLEDCERNDGSAEKPYYMSKNLMGIFGRKNKMA